MLLSACVCVPERGYTLRCECVKKKHKQENMSVLAFVICVCVREGHLTKYSSKS